MKLITDLVKAAAVAFLKDREDLLYELLEPVDEDDDDQLEE